jgi:hypothetical protein
MTPMETTLATITTTKLLFASFHQRNTAPLFAILSLREEPIEFLSPARMRLPQLIHQYGMEILSWHILSLRNL